MSGHAELDAEVILQHSGFIRSLARGLLRDESLVDDVVQETLIKALEKGPRHRGALTAWLRTVTRNIAYKTYRGTARRRAREEEAAQPERLTATVDIVARGEALESLTASVMDLPEAAREVVFLRYYEGLSHAQISEQLGVAPGAVRMRLHRAQKLLHERLDRTSDGDRAAWMSGLAGLAGIGLKDIGRGLESPAGVTPVATSTVAIAAAATICVTAGALFWFGTRPDDVHRGDDLVSSASVDAVPLDLEESELGLALAREGEREDVPVLATALTAASEVTEAAPVEPVDEVVFPDGNLQGTVVDRLGQPVADAFVFAAWGRQPVQLRTRTNASGRFGVEVPAAVMSDAEAGLYSVLLGTTSEGSAPTRVYAWPKEGIDDALGGKHALLEMRGPGGAIEGSVRGADGRPIVGAVIRLGERNRLGVGFLGQQSALTENPLAPQLATIVDRKGVPMFQGHRSMRGTLGPQVLEADGTRSRLLPATQRESTADGSFRFGGLELGTQKMRISAPGYAPWNGTVRLTAGAPMRRTFYLDRGATVRGRLTRDDGLPVTQGIVHAIHRNPYTAKTVRMKKDGTFAIPDLPPGTVRIVAEERWPRVKHAPRMVSRSYELQPGEDRAVTLELHRPAHANVRVMVRSQGELMPAHDIKIELRAIDNPLDRVADFPLDAEGRAQIPLETTRPVEWVIARRMVVSKSPSGARLSITDGSASSPVRRLSPPTREEAQEEIVYVLEERELVTAPVLMRPVLKGSHPFDHKDGFSLFQTDTPFTFVGWASGKLGELQFNGVPNGDYHIMYPHHGLGWISPFTVRVGAAAADTPQDLGEIELPALGYLGLIPAAENLRDDGVTRWTDLDIKAVIEGANGKDAEIAVFLGRAEIPGELKVSPGTYVLRHPGQPELGAQWITIKEGARSEVLWR